MKFEKTNAARALAELSRQTGLSVDDRIGNSGEEFSIDMPVTTFWPALDAIARAARGRLEFYARDGRLALVHRPSTFVEPPVSYSGLFRTAIRRISVSHELDSRVTNCTATLEVAWEPDLEPLFLDTSPRDLVIHDEHGKSLTALEQGSGMVAVDGRLAWSFDVALPAVPRTVTRLGLVEGKLTAIAPTQMVNFNFDTLDRLAEVGADSPLRRRQQQDVACRLSKVQLARDHWTVQVELEYPPSAVKLDSYQSRVANNEMVLEAKDGSRRLVPGGYVVDTATDRKARISYHFFDTDKLQRGQASEWKVRYRAPAALIAVPLTFTFKNVPLP